MTTNTPSPGTVAGMSPLEKALCAISILQNYVAGSDSALEREKMWGAYDMPAASIEVAITLLIEILPQIETLPDGK